MLLWQIWKSVFSLSKPQSSLSQFARFIFTGGFTAGLDFFLLVVLVDGFSLHYLAAGGISFVVAVALNYFISRNWVFDRGKYSAPIECLGFFTTSGIGLGLNQIILWVSVSSFSIDYKLSKIISIGIVTLWNFLTKKYIVFGARN